MYTRMLSAAVSGLEILLISVEADVSDGLPQFTMVGCLSSQVREAEDRVKTAFRNSGIILPPKRITINLSPADVPKSGSSFDLPIALSILASDGFIPAGSLDGLAAVGELSLDGGLHGVRGVLPIAAAARKHGIPGLLVASENVREASSVSGIAVIGASSLTEVIHYLRDGELPPGNDRVCPGGTAPECPEDFRDIRGQACAKRAALIAAAGFHNLLLTGSPGSGKSMLAKRIPGILPPLTEEESLEISQIYSIAGLLDRNRPLMRTRPFRHPHHTISPQALAGGGKIPVPGEITLAHRGVLFLDEIPEFSRKSLEILRQPLEDREIVISRTRGTFRFPASFLLLAAMNPCPCGYYPDQNRCSCTPRAIAEYRSRISRPLLDRIDMQVFCPEVTYDDLISTRPDGTGSSALRSRVMEAAARQQRRFRDTGIHFNSEIPPPEIERFCPMTGEASRTLRAVYRHFRLSGRGCHRVIRTARTIADLEESDIILPRHIEEAAGFRVEGNG